MRRKKQLTACLLAFALLLGMIPASEVSAAKKVSLSNKKLTVTKGKSKTLKVKNTKKKVKWKILSGKKYISLKKKGKVAASVKGKKKGTAKIQATVGKKKLTCKVTVKNVKTSKITPASPVTATPTTKPTATPTAKPTATPLATSTNASENDAEALKNLIAEQKKQGALSWLSEDIQDSEYYTWENGRLVGIDWEEVDLKGELSTEKFSALRYLNCSCTDLSSLDVTKNTALTYLDCGGNQLSSLDITKNTALTELHCYGNQLTSLDVTKNTALTSLSCYGNQLTSLDITKNTALTTLGCNSNQLSSLDVTKNTALTSLYCYDNQLTSLDVTKNTALTYLYCRGNQLTSLDVTKNTELLDNNISCDENVTIIRNNN